MRELKGGCYSIAMVSMGQAHSQSLIEVANATIHLLRHSNTTRPEHDVEMPDQPEPTQQDLTDLWDTYNVPWEERMGFNAKMLELLEGESDNGRLTAAAGALVVTQELQDLREQLITMPGGHLCVAT